MIRTILVEEFELDLGPEELDADADFVSEYEADSLAIIQVLARIERELGCSLSKEQLGEVVTLRGVTELFARARSGAAGHD
ncbi:acyl carrier protein [Saccharopolyspora taberi]|uniref:acyl carrier protein n=1 Tax=Saccharopolyspora taberi TaxID=60895 RepID=UPI0031DE6F9D